MSSTTQSTTTTASPVCAECRGMKNLKDPGVFSLAVKNPRIQCVCASKEDLQKFICEMYWIGENGGDTAEEVVAFIKKHKLLDLEEDEEDEEDSEDKQCSDCEYTLSKSAFDSGKGRIMFDDLEEGKFRCGVCDDRVSDPMGMFPDDEEEVCCIYCGGLGVIRHGPNDSKHVCDNCWFGR